MKIKKFSTSQLSIVHSQLVLFFGGWGTEPEQFAHLQAGNDTDVWICYDYALPAGYPEELTEEIQHYKEVHLVAWSLGVWAVEEALGNFPFTFSSVTAINGTLCPMDDTLGIPEARFRGTLEGLSYESLARFNRRMCGSRDLLAHYDRLPARPLAELRAELQGLYDRIQAEQQSIDQTASSPNRWTQALISTDDRIFPTENLRSYWLERCTVREIKAPHYPFHLFKQWEELWT